MKFKRLFKRLSELLFSPSLWSGLAILFCCGNAALARDMNYRFSHLTQESGLPNNQIQAIFQDFRGFLWFGTSQGASRYEGYRFTVYENNPDDKKSLRGNLVRTIFEDSRKRLLIGTENGGLNIYDRQKEYFIHPFDHFPELDLGQASVNHIEEDRQGRLWLGSDNCLLMMKSDGSLTRVNPEQQPSDRLFAGNFVRVMAFDSTGFLWIGTNQGVFLLDTLRNRISHFALPVPGSLNEEIWEIVTDDDGRVWIGTYDNGLFVADRFNGIIQHIIPDPANPRSKTVRSVARDKKGNYWLGTRGGLYVFDKTAGITGHFVHDEREKESLSGNSVLDIFHDAKGDTWIGTRSGVNFLVHSKQVFRNFRAMPNDKRYLNSSEVFCFWYDHSGELWIGTEDGGVNIYDTNKHTFEYLVHDPKNPASLSSDCIKAFLDDGRGNLWIGTYMGGISVFRKDTRRITNFRHQPGNPASLPDDKVWCLFRDSKANIWVGTSSGPALFKPGENTFQNLSHLTKNIQVNWIGEDMEGHIWFGAKDEIVIYSPLDKSTVSFQEPSRGFFMDFKGRYWVTTLNKGLAEYSKTSGALRYFGEKEGMASNLTLCVLDDDDRFLWISTPKGLTRFNPETGYFQSFTARDGLQNDQFNYGAALKLPNGELVFGGISGFNIFNPKEIINHLYAAPIVLTDLRIFNRHVEINPDRKSILRQSITETSAIALPYSVNVFSIEFAALNFVNSNNNLYSYYLEGFDAGWNDPSTIRNVTYTNLDPGEYKLWIKSVVPGIPDSGNQIVLNISILPPYWKTWWFKTGILLLIVALFLTLFSFLLNREKLKNELVLEKLKARKLHELDMLKLRFFTNVSHEIRTPLTLILSPLEKLKNNQVPDRELPELLDIMHRNAHRLNQLISQILDFRKLETGNLKLHLTDGELVSFISDSVKSFQGHATDNGIQLIFIPEIPDLFTRFDTDKLGKIMNNLLSNAFKFTDRGGIITVRLALISSEETSISGDEADRIAEISITDTGKGIPATELDKVFIRFFRSEQHTEMPGTGIGLALVKELVKMHHGEVFVSSTPGKGSCFTVRLPVSDTAGLHENISENPLGSNTEGPENVEKETGADGNISNVLLVVEDNSDVRRLVKNHFGATYRVLEAADGLKGWNAALAEVPDMVLCDVMMPGMNGIELLKKIKSDERTSHIPVIMITALGSRENELEGLAAGADDYISKPFDLNILQTKIENILAVRRTMKLKYAGEFLLQPKNILLTPPDERFLKRAIEVVEEYIADADLDIEKFASEVGVSRMQLYRKLSALTDMTVKEFIRHIRLKRAAQLLSQKQQSISEVAYSVGFKDLSHFRKCFRQEFGMSATEYVENKSGTVI